MIIHIHCISFSFPIAKISDPKKHTINKKIRHSFLFPFTSHFFDRLKSVSRGYASLDYQFMKFEPSRMSLVEVLINGEKVDALALIIHKDNAASKGRLLTEKMNIQKRESLK